MSSALATAPSHAPSPAQHPPSLLPASRALEFVCPLCRGGLAVERDAYTCAACDREYRLHGGIPDFRVFPDPFLSFEEDRERTDRILEVLDQHALPSLLEFYWSLSDITPVELRPKYVQSALRGESRARRLWRLLPPTADRTAPRVLEIGSGTGNFLAVAAAEGASVIGTDIAMRWLHVSRRRFLDRGLPLPPLVCCCAEHLPFRESQFDRIVSAATLEFVRDPEQSLAEAARVLRDRGSMLVNMANRYSLARDPYSQLRGVGYLPRRWQGRYVRWRNRACYEHTRPLSLGELRRLARRHFRQCEVSPADVDDVTLREQPAHVQVAVRAYRGARRARLLRKVAVRVAPEWDAILERPHGRACASTQNDALSRPAISVVIAAAGENDAILECLEALGRQLDAPDHEIIVAHCTGFELRNTLRRRFPQVHFIEVDAETPLPQLRARGITLARGRIVAITEDHCLPAPDWLRRIVEARAAGHAVVGGEVENACTARMTDRAAFLCEYGRFIAPLEAGPASDLPASNVAYDRNLLQRLAAEWQDGYCETRLHARMRRAGIVLHGAPHLRVRHKQSFGFCEFLRARFEYSRAFAAERVRDWPLSARFAYAMATPLILPLQAARFVRTAVAKPSRRREFLLSAPLLSVFLVAWGLGEALGAAFGAGCRGDRSVRECRDG